MRRILFIFSIFISIPLAAWASPFHDQCGRVTEDPVELYYALTSIEGKERLVAIEEQNQILINLKRELVTDSVSQLVWSYLWRPYIRSLTLAISTTNLPYEVVKKELMTACYETSDRYESLVNEISRSRQIFLPTVTIKSSSKKSLSLPTLITPFGNGWIDTNGTTYMRQGSSIVDSKGGRIDKVGNYYRSSNGEVFSTFGDGYIDSNSSYSVRKFGHGYMDSNGRSVQPFGKGWVIR
jgi:hypothetical protein